MASHEQEDDVYTNLQHALERLQRVTEQVG